MRFMTDLARRQSVSAVLRDVPVSFEITGRSMEPTYRHGERVRLRRARWYLPGDVVAFLDAHDQPILHRMLGFHFRLNPPSALMVTKGDNSDHRDAPFPRQRILGRVDPVCWRARFSGLAHAGRLFLPAVIRRMARVWSQRR